MTSKAASDLKAFFVTGLVLLGWVMIVLGTLLFGFLLITLFAKGVVWTWQL